MDEKETGRLEAFSDGVFAVAITLLVLGFQPPKIGSDDALLTWLREQWPILFAFVTSFATIGVMWINHHRLYTHIKRMDSVLMALNLLLLMVIVFIPYPTELVAQYITQPDHHVAALLYSATSIVLAVAFNVLWRYAAYEHRLLGKNVNQHEVQAITEQYRFGPLLYLISFGVAWFIPLASVALNLLYAVYFALPGRKLRKSPDSSPSTDAAEVATSDQTSTVQETDG